MRELNEDEQGLRNQIDSYQDDLEKIRNNFVYNKLNFNQRELLKSTIEMLNRLGEDLVSEIIHDYE
jgi:GTPase involved in cell partitioning and DNA repair